MNNTFDRRQMLRGSAGALAAGLGAGQALAQTTPRAAAAPLQQVPDAVRKEAARTLLNWVGCAVGGSRQDASARALAALINGISSHVLDFDDTHLKTVIHPAGPVAAAILALSETRPVTGREFLHALVLGTEVECRIGNAVYPAHYDRGWHITGTTGVFGAAAASGRLLGLNEQQMRWALGLAATQPVGLREMFGTMTKSFHPGRAAQNGLTAALLAAQGFTADETALEGKDGFAQAVARGVKWSEVTEGLGTRFEAALNTYKPFACGIVTHPAIDAAIQLRNENKLKPGDIAAVELIANPLVLSLTGKTEPRTGLEGKFSIYHCIAAGLIYGAAGERQFQDAVVHDPAVVALRRKVMVHPDPKVGAAQCTLVMKLKDGRALTRAIAHAIGSLEKPMSDAALEAKFADLAEGILPKDQTRRVMDMCWAIEKAPDAGALAEATQA